MNEDPATTGAIDEATPGVDSVLGREVAMVVLPPAAGDALTARTEHVRRLAGLHHPNLVEVYDVDGLAPDTESALVLQHVSGRGLDELTGPWHPEALARVGSQVASGLAHAHAHGVAHGAIGPASIVVDAGLQAWLTGFTAALRPDVAPLDPHQDTSGDVAALGRTLSDAPGTGHQPPAALTAVLHAMADRSLTAREAAERLTRVADDLAAGEDETGIVALSPRYGPSPPPTSPPSTFPPPISVPTPAAASHPVPVPGPVPGPSSGPLLGSRPGRRRVNGRRAALLGGAAVTVALASAFAIWASEGPSGPVAARTAPSSGSTGTAPVADPGRAGGGTSDQGVDASRQDVTTGRGTVSGAVRPPSSVLPPAPVVPVPPPTRTSRTTTTPPTTVPSSTSTEPTTPSTPTSSPPGSTGTTRPTTTPSTSTSSSAGLSPAALAAGR